MRRPWFVIIACVISFGLIVQANMALAALEDILYEKGQITKEEWLKSKADQERQEAIKKWLRLVGQLRAFLKWCLACAAYAAVSRAGRLLKYP